MSQTFSIAFYNLENLFEPADNDKKLDKDYTPEGRFKWNKEKYLQKIDHLALTISKIGHMHSSVPPLVIGVCEVENESCLHDLVSSKYLEAHSYEYVFHESSDVRGIHVAFLYQKKFFELTTFKGFPVSVHMKDKVEPTRDILYVNGKLFGKQIHFLINHWPSRTDGTTFTNHKRLSASKLAQEVINGLQNQESLADILVMGDFNDDPLSHSVQSFKKLGFVNAMESFQKQKKGSLKFKGKWVMFDQILFNKNLNESSWFNYQTSHIFVEPYLMQKSGRHKGAPKRTYIGNYHQGGYSDHFPVFIYFNTH